MLSGNCTETLSIQVSVTIPCSRAKLITNGIAPLPFPLPALLKQYRYIKRGERVRVRGHPPFYATLGIIHDAEPPLDRLWSRGAPEDSMPATQQRRRESPLQTVSRDRLAALRKGMSLKLAQGLWR